jgi:hypothetical protein
MRIMIRQSLPLLTSLLLASPVAWSAPGRHVDFAEPAGTSWPTLDHAPAMPAQANLADQRLRPAVDFESLVRNPATGWMLYDDATGEVAKADEYWPAMDAAARQHASIFYLRWRWAEAEPQEGRYAWLYDSNFKALIAGARQRNLRLAFRFYVNSESNLRQATPDYVRQAGAAGFMENGWHGPLWTPYADDPVFQQKLAAFVAAFAKEFDDPARVDFVDALGLGWWGEGHHIPLKDSSHRDQVLRWILDTYSQSFHKVLLGWQFGTSFGTDNDEHAAILGEDMVYRRDGLGSRWFSPAEKAVCLRLFPRHPLYAERCYWGGNEKTPASVAREEPSYGPQIKTWRDLDRLALQDALDHHANTLDLRTIPDVKRFLTYPDLIEKFKRQGGYRLAPVEVRYPRQLKAGETFLLEHAWVNLGVGVLPNLNQRWGGKYRPVFAIIPSDLSLAGPNPWVDACAEPGEWVRGAVQAYALRVRLDCATAPGEYTMVCAMPDTRHDGGPDVALALSVPRLGSWYVLGKVVVVR